MLNKLLAKLLELSIGRKLLLPLAKLNLLVRGHRTEIVVSLLVVIKLLETLGVLPDGLETKTKDLVGLDPVSTGAGVALLALLEKLEKQAAVLKLLVEKADKVEG